MKNILLNSTDEDMLAKKAKVKHEFQSTATAAILHVTPYNLEDRMRKRLARWNFPDPPAHIAHRAVCRLKAIFSLLPPKVAHLLYSTYFNRWCMVAASKKHQSVLSVAGAKTD